MVSKKKKNKADSENSDEVVKSEKTQQDLLVTCPKCKEEIVPDFNNLVYSKNGVITLKCPSCENWSALPRKEAKKIVDSVGVEYLIKFHSKTGEIFEDEDRMEFSEVNITEHIEELMRAEKIPPNTRKEILDWLKVLPIPTELNEQNIFYLMTTLDSLLKSYFVSDTARAKIVKRFEMALKKEMLKRDRILQSMNIQLPIYQQNSNPMQQSQPPFLQPGQQQTPFQTYFQPPLQPQTQPPIPLMIPPQMYPQIPTQPTQPTQQHEPVQYIVEEDGDYEEVVEELDEKGNVKRVIRRIPKKGDGITESIELVRKLGFMSPAEVFEKMLNLTKELKEEKEKDRIPTTQQEKSKELEVLFKHISDMQKKVIELQEKIAEEKYNREIKLKEKEYELLKERLDKELELLREKQSKELEIMKIKSEMKEGIKKPPEIQELEVKKDFIREVGSDLRDTVITLMDRTVGPLVDVVRANQLMMLKLQEEAGKLPPGTIEKIMTKKPVVEKDVESVKEKLKKIRK